MRRSLRHLIATGCGVLYHCHDSAGFISQSKLLSLPAVLPFCHDSARYRDHSFPALSPPSASFRSSHLAMMLSADDQAVAFWMTAFATLHIGMSAVRDRLIDACGQLAASLNLVDRDFITLPSYWPGDNVGKNQIFPDQETAGRQIYRALYTLVSFTTLLSALSAYLSTADSSNMVVLSGTQYNALFWTAAIAMGASIASLFNASPLGLMPGFEVNNDENASTGIQRNDDLKFRPFGLTRITRHPLILPVVPWGIATAFLTGGRTSDLLLFGGLAAYAVAGCAAQDLRVSRKEGSVGTVFRPDDTLLQFFQQTSFVPFGAVMTGRQPLVLSEFPWVAFFGGCLAGAVIEHGLLEWLDSA